MDASDLYKAGRLREAIDAQVAEVKARPADHARRLFLFELLCFSGELDRARRQVDALKYDENELNLAARDLAFLLDSETARRKFFDEGVPPGFLGPETEQLTLRVEAAGRLRQGLHAEAAALLAQADEATPAVRGKLNGDPFDSLRDADDLFGGVLEVMAQGKYFWVGLDQVVSVAMNPPRFPRDLIYPPARIELESETGEVYLPALYPGSYRAEDDKVRLGRVTDWSEPDPGPVLGVGARVYLVGEGDMSLLDWRELVRDEPDAA